MNATYTYEQIATDYQMWVERFDVNAEMSEAEFNEMSVDEKVELLVEAFGPEAA